MKCADYTGVRGAADGCYGNATVTPLVCAAIGATVRAHACDQDMVTAACSGGTNVRLCERSSARRWCGSWPRAPAWAQAVAGSQVSGVVQRLERRRASRRRGHRSPRPTPARSARCSPAPTARTSFPNLPVGPYQLKVVLQGFNTYVQDGIVLQVSTNPTINVTLAVGSDQRAGHGRPRTPRLVETTNTGVGQVIDNQRSWRCR